MEPKFNSQQNSFRDGWGKTETDFSITDKMRSPELNTATVRESLCCKGNLSLAIGDLLFFEFGLSVSCGNPDANSDFIIFDRLAPSQGGGRCISFSCVFLDHRQVRCSTYECLIIQQYYFFTDRNLQYAY
jgi:hypothetical protein